MTKNYFRRFVWSLLALLGVTVSALAVKGVVGNSLQTDDAESTVLYSWEGNASGAIESGGTATATDNTEADLTADDINIVQGYKDTSYRVIRLRGAKDFSTNVINITFDNELQAGDEIAITAMRNKNAADKQSGALIKFEKGTTRVSTVDANGLNGCEFVNINDTVNDKNTGTEPNTITLTVPEDAAGSKTLTITRAVTGTNLFITKIVITGSRESEDGGEEGGGSVETTTWKDIKADFTNGAFFTSEETSVITAGLKMNDNGTYTRVDANDSTANAVITGKFHSNEHGLANFSAKVKVEGPVKISMGTCAWGSDVTVKDGNGDTIATFSNNTGACYHNDKVNNIAYTYYKGTEATTLTISGGSYTPYFAVEAVSIDDIPSDILPETGTETEDEPVAFSDVSATVAWTVGNEVAATSISDAVSSAVQETKMTVGSDLTTTTYDATSNGGGTLATYQPSTANPGIVPTDMIEYRVKMKKGVTFTPTSFEFDAVKNGTDNAYFSWNYTIDGVESDTTVYSDPKTQILRNNNSNSTVSIKHTENVTVEEGGRVVTLRFYISNVASDKKMSIGNIKINGVVNGQAEVRKFTDFKINFRTDPYTVVVPESGTLPEGVIVNGTFHDEQHGNGATTIKVPVDGPVKFTIGSCQYGGATLTVSDKSGTQLVSMSSNNGCDDKTSYNKFVTYTYNVEAPDTLTFYENGYLPWFQAEACDFIESCNVRYYDVDGKTVIGEEDVLGGSDLAYKYGADDVTVAEGYKFRGWFNSTQTTAMKIAEGTAVTEDLKLYAKATEIEIPTTTSRFDYDMTKTYWYLEDHEAIDITGGKYYNNHGWLMNASGQIALNVAGNAIITVTNCCYSKSQTAIVTNKAGEQVATFNVVNIDEGGADGAAASFRYEGDADSLYINFPLGAYVHGVSVWHVKEFVEYDETTGYFIVPANDGNSFLLALAQANSMENAKIFLPNGTYDLGEQVLTAVSGNNLSIIGESMDGTIIKNAPPKENEGIGTTATLLNTADGLYMQDLTLQNALDYYATGSAGRAVCLQDKGKNTVCKNVKMLSYQDTYYSNAKSNRYWEDSEIHGTVDYLCGDGNVVYQSCKFVNESRAVNLYKGSDVLCAPYCTASDATYTNYGYVFLDCSIETKSEDFTFARSWGGESKAYFVNTKLLNNRLASSRWTAAGMNIASTAFKEYNTLDSLGNVSTPASNVVTFTHNSGDNTYETVMTADEATALTVENIFPGWDPREQTAQAEVSDVVLDGNTLTWEGSSDAYAICNNGVIVAIVTDKEYSIDAAISAKSSVAVVNSANEWSVRAANTRGGFSPETVASEATAVSEVEAASVVKASNGKVFNVAGQEVANSYKGIVIIDGKKVVK